MMETQVQIIIAIILPIFAAAGINLLGPWKNLREIWQVICAIGQIAIIYTIYAGHNAAENYKATLFDILPGIDIGFKVEALGLVYAGIASVLWLVSVIYSAGYMRFKNDAHQTRFFIYFALTIAAATGLAFSCNLITMFIFYEMITLLTYPLVVHDATPEAKRAGRVYLGYLLGASMLFLLPAIAGIYYLTGSMDFKSSGLYFMPDVNPWTITGVYLLFLFGTAKAALMPMHRWLPTAMVAPAPVSGLLHAVAVVKAGVFVIGKVTIYIFGADNIEIGYSLKELILFIVAITILFAGIFALRESSIKRRLAYSTIVNLAIIILAFAMLSKAGNMAAAAHMVSHAMGKITLFFISGALMLTLGINYVKECNGMARKSPMLFICFLICSLSIIGLPYFAGGYSKELLLMASREEGLRWILYLLYASMLLSIGYLLPISYRAFLRPLPANAEAVKKGGKLMKLAILIGTALTLCYPLYERFITAMLEKVVI